MSCFYVFATMLLTVYGQIVLKQEVLIVGGVAVGSQA